MPTVKVPVSIRVHPDDKAEMERLAALHDLSFTAYMTKAGLQRLDSAELDQRLDAIEQRLAHLERDADLGAYR